MKKSVLILAIIIIIILAGISIISYLKMAQYKKVIDYYLPKPEIVVNVDGEITAIQNNTITIKTFVQDPYTLPEKWKAKSIKVAVTDETEIIKHLKDTYKKIGFSELNIGDQVNAQTDENIKNKTEFTAKTIEAYYVPETE